MVTKDTIFGELYIQGNSSIAQQYRFDFQNLWTLVSPQDIERLNKAVDMKFENLQFRYYGMPKLKKPTKLKNLKPFDKVMFSKAATQLFVKDNDLYVLHRDYFSPMWLPPDEYMGAPLSVIMKTFFKSKKSEKFVYPDGWGSVVLRSEAWLRISNVVFATEFFSPVRIAHAITALQATDEHAALSTVAIQMEWEHYWGDVISKLDKFIRLNKQEDF